MERNSLTSTTQPAQLRVLAQNLARAWEPAALVSNGPPRTGSVGVPASASSTPSRGRHGPPRVPTGAAGRRVPGQAGSLAASSARARSKSTISIIAVSLGHSARGLLRTAGGRDHLVLVKPNSQISPLWKASRVDRQAVTTSEVARSSGEADESTRRRRGVPGHVPDVVSLDGANPYPHRRPR
jgi:hypothetical protein